MKINIDENPVINATVETAFTIKQNRNISNDDQATIKLKLNFKHMASELLETCAKSYIIDVQSYLRKTHTQEQLKEKGNMELTFNESLIDSKASIIAKAAKMDKEALAALIEQLQGKL